jgi:hypothetical protein
VIVEVKPGEEVTSVVAGWMVERFVEGEKEKPARKRTTVASSANGRKAATAKKKVAPKKAKPAKKTSKPTKKAQARKKRK